MNEAVAPGAVFQCSPRRGGNTDRAARLFAEAATEAGHPVEIVALRDFAVFPCLGCGACARGPEHRCPLEREDQSRELFDRLCNAPFVAFASPIFFYHVPAQFKAVIDRGQRFYQARLAGEPSMAGLARRPAFCLLAAGRPVGERLFEGTLLTLKYFLAPFNLELAAPLTLRGLDGPDDLKNDATARHEIATYGKAVHEIVWEQGGV